MKTRPTRKTLLLATALLLLAGCSPAKLAQEPQKTEPPAVAQHPAKAPAEPAAARQELARDKAMAAAVAPAAEVLAPQSDSLAMKPAPMSLAAASRAGNFLPPPDLQRESYNAQTEQGFALTAGDPLSTFSIDVDTASYANVRRLLSGGSLPPVGAVRLEEMINYFHYDYPAPENGVIGVSTELGPCPWQPANKLVRIGVKAAELAVDHLPPTNLVFLIDVSGSMADANKLPLLQQSLRLLVDQLTARDRIALVVYAGADRVVLAPTAGDRKDVINQAIQALSAGGSTHASSGIVTAYNLARQSFMPGGNNRVILASDGDFNVGVTSRDELERLVAGERESGVFLTVLGFGMGNYHDDTMEILADKGNGNYAYIDSLLEAKKVLVKERASTLFTLASDVKLQVEFNPARVGAYRLLGYENRALADEDFRDDRKDAGEIGVGHTVTALYELLPPNSPELPRVDALKYQSRVPAGAGSDELLTVKLRYKPKGAKESVQLARPVRDNERSLAATSDDFRFASAVAGFAMLLRHSDHAGHLDYAQVRDQAAAARGADREGYRAEFLRLVEMAEMLEHIPGRQQG